MVRVSRLPPTPRGYAGPMARPFLTARWSNLAIVTYAVPPAALAPYLPPGSGLTLDERDDLEALGAPPGHTALVSLVAFEFLETRVLGIRWPGLVNFPEINLRFYVRQGDHRGVMFIREIVPRRLIAEVARRWYDEPYVCAPIEARINHTTRRVEAEYRMPWPGAGTQMIRLIGDKPPLRPEKSTFEHWIKEHQWGFTPKKGGAAGSWVYEVIHPMWSIYPLVEADVALDFGRVYGPEWGFLSGSQPVSVVLAAGSEVAVYPRRDAVRVRWPVRRGEDLGRASPI